MFISPIWRGWPPLGMTEIDPSQSVVAIAGGIVTHHEIAGVPYTQITWRQSGAMQINTPVAGAQWALVGGGASGGVQNISPGGGGAGWVSEGAGSFDAGAFEIVIGAGGAGVSATANRQGNSGSASSITKGGVLFDTAAGGGYGGATGAFLEGGPGGCGGGSSGTAANIAGGIGNPGFNGGAFHGSAVEDERTAGGGGGARSSGANGAPGSPGAGGAGITLPWTSPVLNCAGGGGAFHRAFPGGTATHGGTPGAAKSLDASNGGGSGGGGRSDSNGSGNGGDGLFVIVFPAANATVVMS